MYTTPASPREPTIYDDFMRQLGDCTVTPAWDGGRHFIQVGRFTQWMRSRPAGSTVTNTALLLNAVYPARILPIAAQTISEPGDDCCVLVFSILLEIGLGGIINEVQKSLVDHQLPAPLDKLKEVFRPISHDAYLNHADWFNNAQWKFRPMKFRWDMEKVFPEEHIIPICRKKEIGSGAQGVVWAVVGTYDTDSLTTRGPSQ
jgi:hypothetical protein